jgi:hypothetical protein
MVFIIIDVVFIVSFDISQIGIFLPFIPLFIMVFIIVWSLL